MASVRILKKSINNLCFDLVSECYVYAFFHKDAENNKINDVIEDIVKLRNDLISKVNNPENKTDFKQNRKHYRGIISEMQKMVDSMDKLSAK